MTEYSGLIQGIERQKKQLQDSHLDTFYHWLCLGGQPLKETEVSELSAIRPALKQIVEALGRKNQLNVQLRLTELPGLIREV